jgi:hypothetical protein
MLRRALRNYCWNIGYFVKASSSREDVQKFIKNLRPIRMDVPLIRVGGYSDGGYIVPDDLSKIDALYSPGVANNSNFELELAQKNIKSYLIDYSVDKAAVDHANIHFDKKFLGSEDNEIYWTLDTWVNKYTPNDKNLMMQIDIEGAEYESFIAAKAETLKRFRVIVAEFHGLDSIFNQYGLKFFNLCFEKILKDFYVVHLHPNNCEGEVTKWGVRVPRLMEITFVRKDSYQNLGFASHFPHPLDQTCVPSMPDLKLDSFWFND